MTEFVPTPEEVEYMRRPLTADEKWSTQGFPAHAAHGFVARRRAAELIQKRADARHERIEAALIQLAEAVQEQPSGERHE